MTWDEAINRSKTDSVPKKMFIDFYTDGVVGANEWMQPRLKTKVLYHI